MKMEESCTPNYVSLINEHCQKIGRKLGVSFHTNRFNHTQTFTCLVQLDGVMAKSIPCKQKAAAKKDACEKLYKKLFQTYGESYIPNVISQVSVSKADEDSVLMERFHGSHIPKSQSVSVISQDNLADAVAALSQRIDGLEKGVAAVVSRLSNVQQQLDWQFRGLNVAPAVQPSSYPPPIGCNYHYPSQQQQQPAATRLRDDTVM